MTLLNKLISFFKVSETDRKIVQNEIRHENIRRVFYLSLIGASVSILHIVLFSNILSLITVATYEWRISILSVHFVMLLLLSLIGLTIYFSFFRRKRNEKLARMCVLLASFLLMIRGALITALDQQATTGLNPYIAATMIASIVLLIEPRFAVLYYSGSYLLFFFLIQNVQLNPEVLVSYQINGLIFTGIGLCLSLIFWRMHITRFKQHKLIENQKNVLEENYNKLKFYSEELKESNATKDKLISVIAHDLKSPLASLISTTKLLSEDFDIISREEIKSIMVSLNKETELTFESLNNLLIWSKTQRRKLEPVFEKNNLQHLFNSSALPLKSLYTQKGITIENNIADSIEVYADPSMIQSVIKNLLINSIKFTHNGGNISASSSISDNKIVIAIRDNGVGMKPEVLKNLFKPGNEFTTSGTQNERGTGLGLQICKEFVELNGGQIWTESETGKGSTFYFSLQKSE